MEIPPPDPRRAQFATLGGAGATPPALERPLPAAGPWARLAAWIGALTGWKRLALAWSAGALTALAMAPVHAVPLLIVGFTVLTWQIDGLGRWQRRLRVAGLTGWAFGFGFFAVGLHWIGNAFLVDEETFGKIMPVAMLLLTAGLGVFPGAATMLARRFWTPGPSRVAVLALAWIALEWVRGWIFTGFPWNLIGYAWGDVLAVMQGTALFGVYGLSLLTVLAAAAPAVLADFSDGPAKPAPLRAAFWPVGAAVLLGLVALWGGLRLAGPDPAGTGVALRLVQPSVPQAEKMVPSNAGRIFEQHLKLTVGPSLEKVRYVLWPEAVMPALVAREPSVLAAIAGVLGPDQALVLGSARYEEARAGRPDNYFNSLHVINGSGQIIASYDKHHLVPFGEYLPAQGLLESWGLTKLVGGRGAFAPGPGLRTLQLPGVPDAGPLICYEAIFPAAVVDPAKRPGWLLNLTDDTWFGLNFGPRQHFLIARTRAIEEGLPLVRAANNGISAVIDARGRIVASLDVNVVDFLDAELPGRLRSTLYARFHNLTLLLVVLVFLALCVWARSRTDEEAW